MSRHLPPPEEHRPYPARVSTILFPQPWRVTSFSEPELTRVFFDAAFLAWREST